MTLEHAFIEACSDLAGLLEAPRRSLRHRSHMRVLKPLHRDMRKLFAGYFDRQRTAFLRDIRPKLGIFAEDRAGSRQRADRLIPDSYGPLSFSITSDEDDSYNRIIAAAITRAAEQAAREIATSATLPDTASGHYLRSRSMTLVTGELSGTTRERLRNAVADAYEKGGTAGEIVAAIEVEFEDMGDKRANVIAQTEVNGAYNYGRHALAESMGMSEKRWVTESGKPCVTCIGNEGEGWIPIAQAFSSGDQFPTAHPSCFCSTDFRSVS